MKYDLRNFMNINILWTLYECDVEESVHFQMVQLVYNNNKNFFQINMKINKNV